MREIKFRAWHKDEKRMFEVNALSKAAVEERKGGMSYTYDRRDVVLMQFIGLKDKNGQEIYEGDIVREYGNDYTPIYQNGIYMAYNVDKINDPYVSTQFNVIWRNGCEVIGNVHEMDS